MELVNPVLTRVLESYGAGLPMVLLGVDWAIGLKFTCGDKNFIVLNIYTPYECSQQMYHVFYTR